MYQLRSKNTPLKTQESKITEYHIYHKLANMVKEEEDSKLLWQVWNKELAHYKFSRQFTNENVRPNGFKIWKNSILYLSCEKFVF